MRGNEHEIKEQIIVVGSTDAKDLRDQMIEQSININLGNVKNNDKNSNVKRK